MARRDGKTLLVTYVTLDELQRLGISNEVVEFNMAETEEDLPVYKAVLKGIVKGCTGKDVNHIASIDDIVATLSDASPKLFLIHLIGEYGGRNFNHHLMVSKENSYLYAIKTESGWKHTSDSKYEVTGGMSFNFGGSYSCMPNDGGLTTQNMKVGLGPLKRALLNLVFFEPTVVEFLAVVVNLFEAARFSFVKEKVETTIRPFLERPSCSLCNTSPSLINLWGKISLSIGEYHSSRTWVNSFENNKPEHERIIKLETVHTIVCMIQGTHKKPAEKEHRASKRSLGIGN